MKYMDDFQIDDKLYLQNQYEITYIKIIWIFIKYKNWKCLFYIYFKQRKTNIMRNEK